MLWFIFIFFCTEWLLRDWLIRLRCYLKVYNKVFLIKWTLTVHYRTVKLFLNISLLDRAQDQQRGLTAERVNSGCAGTWISIYEYIKYVIDVSSFNILKCFIVYFLCYMFSEVSVYVLCLPRNSKSIQMKHRCYLKEMSLHFLINQQRLQQSAYCTHQQFRQTGSPKDSLSLSICVIYTFSLWMSVCLNEISGNTLL